MKDNKGFWNLAALFYTKLQEKKNKRLYESLNQYSLQYINNTKRVLEVGCATGQLTKCLAPEAKEYIATDYSSSMIKKAKKRKIPKAQFMVMDALKLDFPSDSFDAVVVANTLHIIPDVDGAIKEIYRVLKPDGLLIAPTFVRDGIINKKKLFFLEMMGFKTYHKWEAKDYLKFLSASGFNLIDRKNIPASPTMNVFVVGKKK